MTLRNAFAEVATEATLVEVRDAVLAGEFERIKNGRYTDGEEVRLDVPASLINASVYKAVAPDGSATGDPVWTVVRTYFDAAGLPIRERIRLNVAWDSRTTGW